ncbi:MAG: DUF2306 domain-containing protein [Sphingomicrobium sp.]
MTALALSRQKIDLPPSLRMGMIVASSALFALCVYAFARWAMGYAPPTPWVHDVALTAHLTTVIPAIPLGAYLFLTKKGGTRHKLLGKVWLALMMTTGIATVFIRNVNHGQFSWLHIFTLVTFIAVPRALIAIRAGKIDQHKRQLRNFFLGALIIAGLTAFAPGRTMWQWAFGDPSAAQLSHG